MNLKKFTDKDVIRSYVTSNLVNHNIKYKLFNKYLTIDLRDLLIAILNDAGISGLNAEKVEMVIPYDIDNVIVKNILSIVIDKRRFNLKLDDCEIVLNKRQKIDYDNTHPHRWSISQWGKYIESKFWSYYGFQSVELNLRGPCGALRRGKAFGNIRKIILNVINMQGYSEKHVVEYINWAFAKKSQKVSLSLGLMASDSMIQEWLVWRHKKLKEKKQEKQLSEKWSNDE